MNTEADSVLRELPIVRRKIMRTKATLEQLYEDQNALVVRGGAAGLQPVDMARAADPKATKALSESYGQIIRNAARKAREAKETLKKGRSQGVRKSAK